MTPITSPETTPAVARAAMFESLRALLRDCQLSGTNKNDQAIVLIAACIDAGITDGPAIVGTVAHLGFNNRHVGAVLKKSVGTHWLRDGAGNYTSLL